MFGECRLQKLLFRNIPHSSDRTNKEMVLFYSKEMIEFLGLPEVIGTPEGKITAEPLHFRDNHVFNGLKMKPPSPTDTTSNTCLLYVR